MIKRIQQLVPLIALLALCPALVFSQVATGTPPFSSITGGPDEIDLANLNIHWSFPIIDKAGRALSFRYALGFDNSVWDTNAGGIWSGAWQPVGYPHQTFGWTRQTDAISGYMTYDTTILSCGFMYDNWVWHAPDGTAHGFPGGIDTCSNWQSSDGGAYDGSGYSLHIQETYNYYPPTATIYPPSGGSITVPLQNGTGPTYATDANGNYVSSGDGVTFTDTLGVPVLTIANSGGGPEYPTSYTYHAPGGDRTIGIGYTLTTVQTNIGCSGRAEFGPSQFWLLTSINYPDGSSYQIQYEDTPGYPGSKTGRLSQVTLPTGGTISYSYWGGEGAYNGFFCDATTAAFVRTVNDGTNSSQRAFWRDESHLFSPPYITATHVITYPQGDETVSNFFDIFETQRQIYQGPADTGTLLKTVLHCYNDNFSNCATPNSIIPPITDKYSYNIFPSGRSDAHVSYFDTNGRLTEADDYDFVMGGFGAPTRKKVIAYATNLGRIVDHPASVSTEDGAGNLYEQTLYAYDEAGVAATSTWQHGDPPQPQRGNVTSLSQWVSGTTYLSKHFTYYDTGTVNTATDINGAVTTYNYPDSTSTCQNAFPTSVSAPTVGGITLTTSTTYNCDGGVPTSTTDPNGNTKSVVSWDPNFWRPAAVQDQLGNVTNLSYTPATASPFSPAVTESTFAFNSGTSIVDTRTTLDGLGRTHIVQGRQGPTSPNYDSVETDYDSYGRPSRQTIPYVAAAGVTNPSAPATTTTYDALSRPVHVTTPPQASDSVSGTVDYNYYDNNVLTTTGPSPNRQVQYEYDALGHLTSVCELTSAAGSGTCGQSRAQTGYWTTYSYNSPGQGPGLSGVTQNAQAAVGLQQTRSFSYDGLGRMAGQRDPETSNTVFAYDSDATCGTSNGDLVRKVDQAGNATCYQYDAMHRVTMISYPSGPNAAVTPSKRFIYDTYSGAANAKGRLAVAYTCWPATCSTNWLTPELFSYSARGEVTDFYQVTPHSGGAYHLSAAYWPHGALRNFTGLPSLPTIYYGDGAGLDGEGRLTKVSASSGVNPLVPAVSYNNADPATSNEPLGALLSVNLGTTTSGQYDSDSFTYDRNTGRLTRYTFSINGQTDVGALTWNANGNLKTLQITDSISGTTDSQICNYTHDDLGRIATTDCGSVWYQSFNYDPFGNIKKNLSTAQSQPPGVSFQPTYDTTNNTNHISSLPGGSVSYDPSGNLTVDTVHTYSWDAEGKMVSVTTGGSTVNLTYDAMGRMVEQQRGSSYTQVVYAPSGGKLALMNGQALLKAFVPLPGGATAVYNSSGLAYYRHSDHLGSSRLASTPSRCLYYSGAYAPFGESYREYVNATCNGQTDRSFTGQNEDTVSGMADFMYREYSSAQQGRWISPDPAGLGAVNPTDPQSWNRYAYVMNRPLTNTDPLGLDHCSWSDGSEPDDSPENGGDTKEKCKEDGGDWVKLSQQTEDQLSYEDEDLEALYEGFTMGVDVEAPAPTNAAADIAVGGLKGGGNVLIDSVNGFWLVQSPWKIPEFEGTNSTQRWTMGGVMVGSFFIPGGGEEEMAAQAEAKIGSLGIKPYNLLRKLTAGTKRQAHHLIEKRFARLLGLEKGEMLAADVSKGQHQVFTNAWRQAIAYGKAGTGVATGEQVMARAHEIYAEYPEILEALGLR